MKEWMPWLERHRDAQRVSAASRLAQSRHEVEEAEAARREVRRALHACRAWHEELMSGAGVGPGQGVRAALLASCAALMSQRRLACERAEARLHQAREALVRCRSEWARCERAALRAIEWQALDRRRRHRQREAREEREALDHPGPPASAAKRGAMP